MHVFSKKMGSMVVSTSRRCRTIVHKAATQMRALSTCKAYHGIDAGSTVETPQYPWSTRMADDQFQRMHDILAAPSPVNYESAMTEGVLVPMFKEFAPQSWVNTVLYLEPNVYASLPCIDNVSVLMSVCVVNFMDRLSSSKVFFFIQWSLFRNPKRLINKELKAHALSSTKIFHYVCEGLCSRCI